MRLTFKNKSLLLPLFLALTTLSLTAQTLTFGVFTYRKPEKILQEYQPIADHLSRELNVTIILKPLSQELLEREVNEGRHYRDQSDPLSLFA